MIVVTGGRRSGKTTLLIEALREDPTTMLISPTHHMADLLRREYPDLARRIITAGRPEDLRGFNQDTKLLIDNVDMLLTALLGRHPYGGTATGQSHNLGDSPYLAAAEANLPLR